MFEDLNVQKSWKVAHSIHFLRVYTTGQRLQEEWRLTAVRKSGTYIDDKGAFTVPECPSQCTREADTTNVVCRTYYNVSIPWTIAEK